MVLIDEYDKPIIDKIEDRDIIRENREVLKDFYSILKRSDQHLQFVFLTGVSKFSQVSVCSGLNNLNDITMDHRYACLTGCTQEELESNFKEHLVHLAQSLKMEMPVLMEEIKSWYNGYSWDGKIYLYNPFSLLNLFSKNQFGNYWFTSGTPTFLVRLIKEKQSNIIEFDGKSVDNTVFDSFDIDNISIAPLLFQTGYLTVKQVKMFGVRHKYILSYPNEEVKESFLKHLLAGFTEAPAADLGSRILELIKLLTDDDMDGFFRLLETVFSMIPYNIFIRDREAYYSTVVYLILSLIGVSIDAEVQTHVGRVDAVLQTDTHIYVMEYKLGSADEALRQINEKEYYLPYIQAGKKLVIVGVGFDTEKKNISEYKIKNLNST